MEVRGWYIPTWAAIAFPLFFTWYKYVTWTFSAFKAQGIRGPRPWPLVGNIVQLSRKGLIQFDADNRAEYGELVATFHGSRPQLVVYDKDMLKQILVKEFHNFRNRDKPIRGGYGMRKALTMLVDDHWRHVRATVSPTFSGGRLRGMVDQITRCAKVMACHVETKAKSEQSFEFKECCGSYTMDVIASTAFGLDIDSQNDPNNDFMKNAKAISQFSFFNPRILLLIFFPFLGKHISFLHQSVVYFFMNAVTQAMKAREEDTTGSRNDFLQLMARVHLDDPDDMHLDADENSEFLTDAKGDLWSKKGLTHEEILGQGFLFFLAGYETTATTLSFVGYNLACNPDKQKILLDEIDQAMFGHETPDYDQVRQMKYLAMVVDETLRMYPPAPRLNRVTANDITINDVFIAKGTVIGIPIHSLQHDPEVWPDPDKFIPERFTPDLKDGRHACSYLPFGMGPRKCIAMRLALLEIKMAVVCLLRRFRFVTCEETQIPLKLSKLLSRPEKGIVLRLVER